MAITHGYITLAELKATVNDPMTSLDAVYERAIEAASRQIDEHCGRQFWREPVPIDRVFKACDPCELEVDDFYTVVGLSVETDDDDDGLYETVWAANDTLAEPVRRKPGRPYTKLVTLRERRFPTTGPRWRVRVAAQWGWEAVPAPVKQACQILAVDLYKTKELLGGVAGFGEFGTSVRVSSFNPIAATLLDPLRRGSVIAIA